VPDWVKLAWKVREFQSNWRVVTLLLTGSSSELLLTGLYCYWQSFLQNCYWQAYTVIDRVFFRTVIDRVILLLTGSSSELLLTGLYCYWQGFLQNCYWQGHTAIDRVFYRTVIDRVILLLTGSSSELSEWSNAMDESSCNGMASKHRSIWVCTKPPRQWCSWCSYGMLFIDCAVAAVVFMVLLWYVVYRLCRGGRGVQGVLRVGCNVPIIILILKCNSEHSFKMKTGLSRNWTEHNKHVFVDVFHCLGRPVFSKLISVTSG